MNRLKLMKLHSLVAAFVLPVAVMFMVTGALYTWGIKGSYSSEEYEVTLTAPAQPDLQLLTEIVGAQLDTLGINNPEGKPKLKKAGSHFYLEWTGSSRDVILHPTDNDQLALMTVKDTSAYRRLVQLHKAKGGTVFKVYAAAFSVALALLLISGFIMAWKTPALRRTTLLTSVLGFLSFLVVVFLS